MTYGPMVGGANGWWELKDVGQVCGEINEVIEVVWIGCRGSSLCNDYSVLKMMR